MRVFLKKKKNEHIVWDIVECHYNAFKFVLILHSALRWQWHYIHKANSTLKEKRPSYLTLTGKLWGAYCRIWRKMATLWQHRTALYNLVIQTIYISFSSQILYLVILITHQFSPSRSPKFSLLPSTTSHELFPSVLKTTIREDDSCEKYKLCTNETGYIVKKIKKR